MKVSPAGLKFITDREGFRMVAYKDSVGIWTIGVGHTAAAGPPIPKPGMTLTRAEVEAVLARDIVKYEKAVESVITRAPNQNQFDAMVSLCFNIGPKDFAGSTLVKRWNAGDKIGAADAFLAWRKAGGKVLKGLEIRRGLERALFLTPVKEQTVASDPEKVILETAVNTLSPKPSFLSWLLSVFTRA